MSIWNQVGSDIDGLVAGGQSGSSVALSGDGKTLLVSTPLINNDGNAKGTAGIIHSYSIDTVNNTWTSDGEGGKVKGTTGQYLDAVSISDDGSVMVVGGIGMNDSKGGFKIYKKLFDESGNVEWTYKGGLNGTQVNSYYGYAIKLSGDAKTIIVGAPKYLFDGDAKSGAFWINTISNDFEIAQTYSLAGYVNEEFGTRNAIDLSDDGTVAVIGVHSPSVTSHKVDSSTDQTSGLILQYRLSDTGWSRGFYQYGDSIYDRFGSSVAISGDGNSINVGAWGQNRNNNTTRPVPDNDIYTGSSLVLRHSSKHPTNSTPGWWEINDEIYGISSRDYDGDVVDISDDGSVIATATKFANDNAGRVRIYKDFGDGSWTQIGSSIIGESSNDHAGNDISLSDDGSTIAIGAKYNDGNGQSSGHTRVYSSKRNDNSLLSLTEINTLDNGEDSGNKLSTWKYTSTNKNDFVNDLSGDNGTFILTGKFEDYSISRNNDLLMIDDSRSNGDGFDWLKNIEYIQFTDQKVDESKVDVVKTYSGNFSDYKFYNKGNGVYQIKTDSGYDDITGLPLLTFTGEEATSSFKNISAIVDIKGTFDQVTGLDTDSGRMFRLYNASFKRLPDADGLEYWINQFSSGANSIRVVASSFLGSAEFAERYGSNVTNEKFVNTLYQNVLGRAPDSMGLNYWLGQLNSGAETRYEALLGFAESVENKGLFTEMTGFG